MGFTWLFLNPFHQSGFSGSLYSIKDYYAIDQRLLHDSTPPQEQLAKMLEAASQLGLSVMMDLVINHIAFDSPLIQQHPTWFKRDAEGKIVHPGALDGKKHVIWRDLAEVDNEHSPNRDGLWAYWRDVALYYADLGFRGFRCDAAYQVPEALWRLLIAAVKARYPDVLFFAETLGCTPEQTLATAAAGFGFIFNSSKWWDFKEPWCLQQYARTSPVVPSISFPESHDTPRLAEELRGDRAAVFQRYAFAATFSTGVMMPIGFEFGFRKRLHVVETTLADWEELPWDLTGAIAVVNRTKAAIRALNEEGPLERTDLGHPSVFAFRKLTRDRREEVLVILNLDRAGAARLTLRPGCLPAERLAWTDLVTAASHPLPQAGEVELAPSGIAIVHPVPPEGARSSGELR